MGRTLGELCTEVESIVDVSRVYQYVQEYYNTDRQIEMTESIEKDYVDLRNFVLNKVK